MNNREDFKTYCKLKGLIPTNLRWGIWQHQQSRFDAMEVCYFEVEKQNIALKSEIERMKEEEFWRSRSEL